VGAELRKSGCGGSAAVPLHYTQHHFWADRLFTPHKHTTIRSFATRRGTASAVFMLVYQRLLSLAKA
jgi:hypothetical protein